MRGRLLQCLGVLLIAACSTPPPDPDKSAALEKCKHDVTGSNIARRGSCDHPSEQDQSADKREVDAVRDRASVMPGMKGAGP